MLIIHVSAGNVPGMVESCDRLPQSMLSAINTWKHIDVNVKKDRKIMIFHLTHYYNYCMITILPWSSLVVFLAFLTDFTGLLV